MCVQEVEMVSVLRRPGARALIFLAVALIAASAVFFVKISGPALAACPDGEVCPDRSGLDTGSGQSLAGLGNDADGNPLSDNLKPITEDDLSRAERSEPLAVKLADWVNQNRLGVNFMWTLVCGYLVMFMQAGFALVETGFTRAKNAGHT